MSSTFEALPTLFQDAVITSLYDMDACMHGVCCVLIVLVHLCAVASPTDSLRRVWCAACSVRVSEHEMCGVVCSVYMPDCVRDQLDLCWGLGQAR